jgi:sulfite reductase (NADPH) hemoprotein beta-component
MYRYDNLDRTIVTDRVAEFRDQVERRLSGTLSEDAFKPLRLMNGLYLQLHAYMLRVAIPYGSMNAMQLRQLAMIARRYDRGYGHFTTRQNLQYNWIKLADAPDILQALADVDMHAMQTSGNCMRNITADPLAGAAADEIEDPRPWCEILRQWSTLHPELSFLPRKFKMAVTASDDDRAAIRVHDVGLQLVKRAGAFGFRVFIGGGQGRTPYLAPEIKPFVPAEDILSYLHAVMRVYNAYGRRDNIYKARIKILVAAMGEAAFAKEVEQTWSRLDRSALRIDQHAAQRIREAWVEPAFETLEPGEPPPGPPAYRRWLEANTASHRKHGYRIVFVSLKVPGRPPGDISAEQMEVVADLAERFGLNEVRATHEQNLVLPHVRVSDLLAVWEMLAKWQLATPNIGLASDIIACPGLDYCSLANARSIPLAQRLSQRFADRGNEREIGPLAIKISGCINACGHHHVGDIGILGVDKKDQEYYQILLAGRPGNDAALGRIMGPALDADATVAAIERIVEHYLAQRQPQESFAATLRRLGPLAFKDAIYAAA